MTTSTSTRERRDWTLLIFIIPIGIILMLIAGQIAIHLVPFWSINAGMQSNLDPNNLPRQQNGPVQPILPAILTPLGWLDTFLTPGANPDIVFPPFVVFEPTATPVVTKTPSPTVVTQSPSPTVPVTTSPTIEPSVTVTSTKKPPTSTPPTSTPPTTTTTPPTSTPPTSTPPTSTPPTSTPSTPTGTPSTPPVLYVSVTPPPGLDVGSTATPDGVVGDIPSGLTGSYTVLDVSSNPVYVSSAPDGNYDLIFYEATSPGNPNTILLDQISIGISNSPDGSSYYQVFNWGDNVPDTNTNIDPALQPEADNAPIQTSALYADPSTGISTGILIDVDTAPSAPPEGTYNYIVILSPPSVDSAQVDSIVVDEVSMVSAAAPVAPLNNSPAQPSDAAPPDNAPAPPPDNAPNPPPDNAPAPPPDNAPNPPPDNAPATP